MTTSRAKWLTPTLRKELWRRWRQGESILQICLALSVSEPTVYNQIARAGGIEPRCSRRPDALTEAEREEISRCVARDWSVRRIAEHLSRAASTISRELKRNGGRRNYRAHKAERRAWFAARRPKLCKLRRRKRLRDCVARKLRLRWSPEQIAQWLRRRFGDNHPMRVSHETIYRSLFIQARGALKKELVEFLRTERPYRQPRRAKAKRTCIPDGTRISERPASVEDRAVPGHWEGDLLFGNVHTYIATLVERKTRYCLLVKVDSKQSEGVVAALRKAMTKLPKELRRSLTWDRGAELAQHAAFTVETGIPVFFCDPRSPWQRGSNENTNGLLRQYFPKGTDFAKVTQAQLDKVARELNGRPRMTLQWHSPAEALNELLR